MSDLEQLIIRYCGEKEICMFRCKFPRLIKHVIVDDLKKFFHDPTQFYEAKKFIVDFYEVLESDKKFEKEFIKHARNK